MSLHGQSLLIVEDEEGLLQSLSDFFSGLGYAVDSARSLAEGRTRLASRHPDVMLLDLSLPDGSGMDLLDANDVDPTRPAVVVLTGDDALDTAVEAIRRGADDFLAKPFSLAVLRHRIEKASAARDARVLHTVTRRKRDLSGGSTPLLLPSPAIRVVYQEIARVAPHERMPVLIIGETGVGKESICRSIHDSSPRAEEPFLAVNCGEFERHLLRSELFGHERGAFTGATEQRLGLFELANRGSLLLDEVTELPLDVQSLFLRVLEDGSFRRLGSSREHRTDARIIAATNRDVHEQIERDEFRADLYFRLNAAEIHIPPLRERREDIAVLADHFCRRRARAVGRDVELSEAALERLGDYRWPGNIRELRSVVDRAVLSSRTDTIGPEDLALNRSASVRSSAATETGGAGEGEDPSTGVTGQLPTLDEMERRHILRALHETEGNRTRAAEVLGIARSTLTRKLQSLKLDEEDALRD